MDLQDGLDQLGPRHRLTDDTYRDARRYVTGRAADADEARDLLGMLGLLPEQLAAMQPPVVIER